MVAEAQSVDVIAALATILATVFAIACDEVYDLATVLVLATVGTALFIVIANIAEEGFI